MRGGSDDAIRKHAQSPTRPDDLALTTRRSAPEHGQIACLAGQLLPDRPAPGGHGNQGTDDRGPDRWSVLRGSHDRVPNDRADAHDQQGGHRVGQMGLCAEAAQEDGDRPPPQLAGRDRPADEKQSGERQERRERVPDRIGDRLPGRDRRDEATSGNEQRHAAPGDATDGHDAGRDRRHPEERRRDHRPELRPQPGGHGHHPELQRAQPVDIAAALTRLRVRTGQRRTGAEHVPCPPRQRGVVALRRPIEPPEPDHHPDQRKRGEETTDHQPRPRAGTIPYGSRDTGVAEVLDRIDERGGDYVSGRVGAPIHVSVPAHRCLRSARTVPNLVLHVPQSPTEPTRPAGRVRPGRR
jgi:hypothetical protein